MQFRYFVKKIFKLTFALIVLLSILSLNHFEFFEPYRFFTWVSLFFFMGLTLFSGYYNSRSVTKPFFFNIFIATLGLKFLLSLAFLMVFLYGLKTEKMIIVPFFLLFTIYKVFETYMLLKFAREAERIEKSK